MPKQIVEVNGNAAMAMVDTGFSRTILAQEMIENRERHRTTEVTMMNGDTEAVEEARNVKINVGSKRIVIDCLVGTLLRPYQMLIGMDLITMMGGLQIDADGQAKFLGEQKQAVVAECQELKVADKDGKSVGFGKIIKNQSSKTFVLPME